MPPPRRQPFATSNATSSLSPHERSQVDQALAMYREGWFPMAELESGASSGHVEWVQPHERSIIPLEDGGLVVSRSLRQRVRAGRFRMTSDTAISEVLHACAAPRVDAEGKTELGWLSDSIIELVLLLARAGHAHTIEAWLDPIGEEGASREPVLVGGLYGIVLGSIFCGESMFSRPELGGTDASKVCLVQLWRHLRAQGFAVLDTQIINDHMASLGAREIRAAEYHQLIKRYADQSAAWGTFRVR